MLYYFITAWCLVSEPILAQWISQYISLDPFFFSRVSLSSNRSHLNGAAEIDLQKRGLRSDYCLIITDPHKILLFSLSIISAISAWESIHIQSSPTVWGKRWRSFLVAGKLSGVILNALKRSILQWAGCTAIFLIMQPASSNIFNIAAWLWYLLRYFSTQ